MVVRGQTFRAADIGVGTNDDAEWLAVLHGLDVARALGATDVLLVGDSRLIVNQASGKSPCRSANLRPHLTAFVAKAEGFERVRLRHVRRGHNLAGIALEAARRGS